MFDRIDPRKNAEELDKMALNQLVTMFGTVTEKMFKASDRRERKDGDDGNNGKAGDGLLELHKILEKPKRGHRI